MRTPTAASPVNLPASAPPAPPLPSESDHRNWLQHPRAQDVIRLVDLDLTPSEIQQRLQLNPEIVNHIFASYVKTEDYEHRRREQGKAISPMPSPHMIAAFKRMAFVEETIQQRKAQGKPTSFWVAELDAWLWLLDRVGVTYERPAVRLPRIPEAAGVSPADRAAALAPGRFPRDVSPLPVSIPADTVRACVTCWRSGSDLEQVSAAVGIPVAGVRCALIEAGYSVPLAEEEHRHER